MKYPKFERLRKFREAKPFRRFEIELTSGSRVLVNHPEDFLLTRHEAAVRLSDEELVLIFPGEVCVVRPRKRNGRNGRRNGR